MAVSTQVEDVSIASPDVHKTKKSLSRKRRIKKHHDRNILKARQTARRAKKRKNKLRAKKKRRLELRNQSNEKSFFRFIESTKFCHDIKPKTKSKRITIEIPKDFSLIENPDETIEVYKKIFSLYKEDIESIRFDHSKCQNIDIGASAVMDVFTLNIDNYFKSKKKSISYSGVYPKDIKNKVFLIASGILEKLNVETELRDKLLNMGRIEKLGLLSGGRHTNTFRIKKKSFLMASDGQSSSNIAATKIVDYFNACLGTQGYMLENEGQHNLSSMVSEAINNCEIHSGQFCQWFACGHYLLSDNDGECHLVLFNFGQTIYEGLKNAKSPEMVRSMENLYSKHNGKLFAKWDEEVLWTLYSLQEGISRCKSEDEPDRGQGTVELIEAFQEIGQTVDGKIPVMSIISGHSYIYFNNKYPMRKKVNNSGEERSYIAFNKQNDLTKPPDTKNVRKLKNFFPGTVITFKFYLDKKFMEENY